MSHFHSNLPMSCSSEMVEAFHGQNRNEDSYQCDTCLREDIDPLDLRAHDVTRKDRFGRIYNAQVCGECIKFCDICGEYMDDSTADRGPLVNYREAANDGRLTHGHAECVGEWMAEDLEFPSGKHWSEMALDPVFNGLAEASRKVSK